MTITTGIAIYGAVLSTVGVGWNFYHEWKERRKAADKEAARRMELKRALYAIMQRIPGIECSFTVSMRGQLCPPGVLHYSGSTISQINGYLSSLGPELTSFFDLPEAVWLHDYQLPTVGLTCFQQGFDEAMESSYAGFLKLVGAYQKLKRDVTNGK